MDYARLSTESVTQWSAVPQACRDAPCVLGIDEAGRGPVLGPMVYAICYVPEASEAVLRKHGAFDSKTLTDERRKHVFASMKGDAETIGYAYTSLAPQTLSGTMLRRRRRNLNEIAHDATIALVAGALDAGVRVMRIQVDTVGPPESYQALLARRFPGLEITVAKKADALYPSVSAASVVAKVVRDSILENWTPVQPSPRDWGSGYPGDARTTGWLTRNMDPIFGWPGGVVRYSWATASTMLDRGGVVVSGWPEDVEERRARLAAVRTAGDASGSNLVRSLQRSRAPSRPGLTREYGVEPLTLATARKMQSSSCVGAA